jgi:adenine-specific DNA-methyltransferase
MTPNFDLRGGDAFKLVDDLDDGSLQLTVTSPPYNIGKVYEKRTKLAEYLKEYEAFARALFAKTASSGHVCWQVGNFIEGGEVYPLDIFFYDIFKDAGFHLRNRIIWHFEHGLHAKRRLSGRYETILWFSKGDEYVFNLDNIRVPSKYPGKRAYKGPNQGKPTGNPLGKNPSDFWPIVAADWDAQIWDIPNVKANHPEKSEHPCQFPVELVQRCVLALSNEGDVVLDPFMGVGSTAIAALLHDRRFIGFEWDAGYLATARQRLADFEAGTLKLRPLGRPVHTPKGTDRVAQVPDEWLQSGVDVKAG